MAKLNKLIEEYVIHRLETYANALDTKNWDLLKSCINDIVVMDYNTFKGDEPKSLSALEYIDDRFQNLRNINTTHNFGKYKILKIEEKVHCHCDFSIKRFDLRQNEYFHSYGKYTFILGQVNQVWKIEKIIQTVEKNEGLDLIHGAFSMN